MPCPLCRGSASGHRTTAWEPSRSAWEPEPEPEPDEIVNRAVAAALEGPSTLRECLENHRRWITSPFLSRICRYVHDATNYDLDLLGVIAHFGVENFGPRGRG